MVKTRERFGRVESAGGSSSGQWNKRDYTREKIYYVRGALPKCTDDERNLRRATAAELYYAYGRYRFANGSLRVYIYTFCALPLPPDIT